MAQVDYYDWLNGQGIDPGPLGVTPGTMVDDSQLNATTPQAPLDVGGAPGLTISPGRQGQSPAYVLQPTSPSVDPGTVDQRDALAHLKTQLAQWGFTAQDQAQLGEWMWDELIHGRSETEVSLDAYNTDAFKRRFPAIFTRQQKGLSAISPGDYVANEAKYAQAAKSLPAGFYDNHADWDRLMADDWSPDEFKKAVDDVYLHVATQAAPEVRAWFAESYGVDQGDSMLAAMILDDVKALPVLEMHARAAELGGRADVAGFHVGVTTGEELAAMGTTDYQLSQGLSQVRQQSGLLTQTAGETNQISGEDAVKAALGLSPQAAEDLRRRQAERQAAFAGSTAAQITRQGVSGLGAAESNT